LFKFEQDARSFSTGAFVCRGGGSSPAKPRVNSKSKIQEEAYFQILGWLHANSELTQRELGERVGVSLGSVNYCLRALIEGLSKQRTLDPALNKAGYIYLLTPLGIAEKWLLTARFLSLKIAEYESLRREIEELSLDAVDQRG
jgi:EPS-associated MarR family transcriptional regulator